MSQNIITKDTHLLSISVPVSVSIPVSVSVPLSMTVTAMVVTTVVSTTAVTISGMGTGPVCINNIIYGNTMHIMS